MALHLVKLCVGVPAPQDLMAWHAKTILQQKKRGEKPALFHITRMTPRRREELLKGGSLYWVFSGFISARQKFLNITPIRDKDGRRFCRLELDLTLTLTESFPRRPFQGWRYLEEKDAPPDLKGSRGKKAKSDAWGGMPQEMREALQRIGVR